MARSSQVIPSAKDAARTALIIFFGIIALAMLQSLLGLARTPFNFTLTLRFALFVCIVSYFPLFIFHLVVAMRAQPAVDILAEKHSSSDLADTPLSGFVAMEYYWLIMNRTYLVFIAPEGLYGWLAHGPVGASDPFYFEPYRQLLQNEEFMRDRGAIQKLSRLSEGFFLSRSEIAAVVVDRRRKAGMTGIPHGGRIQVRLTSGKSREFILLGDVNPDQIRYRIMSVLGSQATSPV